MFLGTVYRIYPNLPKAIGVGQMIDKPTINKYARASMTQNIR